MKKRTRSRELALQFLYQVDLLGPEKLQDLTAFLQEQGEGGGEAAAEPAAEGTGEGLSPEHCCRGGEEGGAEEVRVLRGDDEGKEEKRLQWEEVERTRHLLAAEGVVRLPAELGEVPLLRESEQGLPEVEGREEAVEVD